MSCYYGCPKPCTCPQPAKSEEAYIARLMARPKMPDLSLLSEPWPDPEPPTDEALALGYSVARAQPERAGEMDCETCPTPHSFCRDPQHGSEHVRECKMCRACPTWQRQRAIASEPPSRASKPETCRCGHDRYVHALLATGARCMTCACAAFMPAEHKCLDHLIAVEYVYGFQCGVCRKLYRTRQEAV